MPALLGDLPALLPDLGVPVADGSGPGGDAIVAVGRAKDRVGDAALGVLVVHVVSAVEVLDVEGAVRLLVAAEVPVAARGVRVELAILSAKVGQGVLGQLLNAVGGGADAVVGGQVGLAGVKTLLYGLKIDALL